MPYAKIESSGCGVHKYRTKLRIDLFMNPDDPHYEKGYSLVPIVPKKGYQGKVDKRGIVVDQADYDAWKASLPHIWQCNPFHHNFIYPVLGASDNEIKEQIERCLDYFYSFHKACWDNDKKFWDEWKKVPKRVGDIRHPFVKGDPKDLIYNEQKVTDILSRIKEFEIGKKIVSDTDLPGGKGTITCGSAATDRGTQNAANWTSIEKNAPADGTGTLDTISIYVVINCASTKAGTFSGSGTSYTNRDYHSIGDITAGAPDPDVFTSLDIDVVTGDFMGHVTPTGYVERDAAGLGYWYKLGDQFDAGTQTYAFYSPVTLSVQGTGTEAAAGWAHNYLGVANANIGSINGVAMANVAAVNGVA